MAERYTIELDIPLDVALDEARQRLARHGGTISGNIESGTFSVGGIRGAYSVSGSAATIIVTDRPGFLEPAFIRAALRRHLDEVREFFHAPAGWGD